MKKIRGDKTSGVMIHTHMEISQGSSLCSHLYLKLKCHVFHFIFSLFFSYKIREQEGGTGTSHGGRAGTGEERRCWGKER
jgi:hypothetical protein